MPGVAIAPVLVPVLMVGTDPPQLPVPPLALQDVAPLVVQDNEADPPACMLVGDTLKDVTVACAGGVATLMVTELGPLAPPVPLQFNV